MGRDKPARAALIRFSLIWSALILYAFGCAYLFTTLLQVGQPNPLPHIPYCMTPIGMAFPCREVKGFWRSA